MERIQFYPEIDLATALNQDALSHGVAVSTLVTDILKRHYGLAPISTLSETELNLKVFNEVRTHISSLKSGQEFDLYSASVTFAGIEMEYAGKPSIIRAKIGKSFAKAVNKTGDFKNVSVQLRPDGKIKRTKNNAAVYVIVGQLNNEIAHE